MATKDLICSGSVVEGTNEVISLANNLLKSFKSNRCCALTIANATQCTLTNPHRYIHHGAVISMPLTIKSGNTGLIGAQKLSGSIVGTSGVVTYDISNTLGNQKLQVMWRVPLDLNTFGNKLNIAVGEGIASQELFQEMLAGKHGELVTPTNAEINYQFPVVAFSFNIKAVMKDTGRTPLAVYFENYDMTPFYSFVVF